MIPLIFVRRFRLVPIVAFVAVLSLVAGWPAQAVTESDKFQASDADISDIFGLGIAISGDTAVIGASRGDEGADNSGSAYIFDFVGGSWSETDKLVPDDPALEDRFGAAVAIDGDTVVCGTREADNGGTDRGSAYVFVRSGGTWSQQAKLTASDPSNFARFGCAVAISGDTILVGAYNADEVAFGAGAAYVFVRSGTSWTQEQKLIISGPNHPTLVGSTVDLEGDRALIGGVLSDVSGFTIVAYAFERSSGTWTLTGTMQAGAFDTRDMDTYSLDLAGDTVAIATGRKFAGEYLGYAYTYRLVGGAWTEDGSVHVTGEPDSRHYGDAVVRDGNTLFVGVGEGQNSGVRTGFVAVYTRSGSQWVETGRLLASDGVATDRLGERMAMNSDHLLVSARSHDNSKGAVYVFGADQLPPTVDSITQQFGQAEPGVIRFTVTFSEAVTGVDAGDFTLAASGITGESIAGVSGGGAVYYVDVDTGTGTGTVALHLIDDDSIVDGNGNPLAGTASGSFTGGTVVDIVAELPVSGRAGLLFAALTLLSAGLWSASLFRSGGPLQR